VVKELFATSAAAPKLPSSSDRPLAGSQARGTPGAAVETVNPHHRGGQVLFEIRFTSPMRDVDLAHLAQGLDMSTHMYPKMRPDPNSPGVARLDQHSGLFLEHGRGEDQWLLQARTWGRPAPQTVHEWHLLAAQAARRLDPQVPLPERVAEVRHAVTDRPVGAAANKRLARIRRRLVGLP